MKFKHVRNRIAFFMATLTVLSLGISWLVNFIYFSNTISEQVIQDNRAIVQKAAERIDNELEYVEHYANTISYDKTFQTTLRDSYGTDVFARNAAAVKIATQLADYTVLNKGTIYDIYAVDKTGTRSTLGRFDGLLQESWYTDIVVSGVNSAFSKPHITVGKSATNYRENTISYVGRIKDLENMDELLGTLVVNLDLSQLFSGLKSNGESSQAYYMLNLDKEIFYGEEEAAPNFKNLKADQGVQHREGHYFITEPVPALGAYLVSMIPEGRITEALMGSMGMTVLSLFCGLFITGVFAMVLSKSITKPIITLSEGMKESVDQNFERKLDIEGVDELSEMTRIFNDMQQQTKDLIEQKKEMGKRDRELRMKYFMSKINPHFIYNTLNCVIYLARKGESGEIIPLTRALIAILKTNIALGETPIHLSDEVDYLTNYFYILKYRYNDQIQIRFEIPRELMGISIQPMILYPLVENSVFHGIAPAGRSGTVCVQVFEAEERIVFRVSDDGVGMSDEKLTELLHYINSETGRNIYGSIGLRNVNDRLRLFYTSCKGLEAENTQGTHMWFSIEKKELSL